MAGSSDIYRMLDGISPYPGHDRVPAKKDGGDVRPMQVFQSRWSPQRRPWDSILTPRVSCVRR